MNELFIVNMKRIGFDYWECFRSTHNLASATEWAEGLREAGHEANVQSVLIDVEGMVLLGEEAQEFEIVRCQNGVGEWEIHPTGETFDTRDEAETRLAELLAT